MLTLLTAGVELGNYFIDEHKLVKAVRDGARYAARQDISNFTTCSGTPGGTVDTDTKNVVMTGMLSGGTKRLPNWNSSTITVAITRCTTTAGGTALSGFYASVENSSGTVVGAPIVTVTASVPYTSVLRVFGFNGFGLKLNASEQAAVMGW
jgi:Flp pilus assembly protein TadG